MKHGKGRFGTRVLPVRFTRLFIQALLLFSLSAVCSCTSINGVPGFGKKKIPVIFDTDICDDIDDTWALALLLQSPEFDVRLITTAVGDTPNKAKVVAKMLEIAGRTDIPIGIGPTRGGLSRGHRQDAWIEGYDMSSYRGKVYEDGVQAIVDTIMKSSRPIKVVAVGPLPNIAAALEREPRIAQRARFVGMHGSIRLGYGGAATPSAEYNVRAFVKEAQEVFTAPWDITITPLDTCGIVHLKDEKYKKVLNSDNPLAEALMQNYRAWYSQGVRNQHKDIGEAEVSRRTDEKVNSSSTTLFDTVGIYLAMTTELVHMEELGIKVTDDGYTRIDDNAKVINCATKWKDLGAFEHFLVARLTK